MVFWYLSEGCDRFFSTASPIRALLETTFFSKLFHSEQTPRTPNQQAVDCDLPHAARGSGPGRRLLGGLVPVGTTLVGYHRGSLVPSVTSIASAVHRVPATISRAIRVVEAVVDGGGRRLGSAGALSLLALALDELLLLVELLVQVLVQLWVVDAHLLKPGNVLVVLGGIKLVGPPGLEDGHGGGLSQVTGEVVIGLAVVDTLDETKVNEVLASASGRALQANVSDC